MPRNPPAPTSLPRWADPALTVLAIELALTIFIIVPLGVLAPRHDGVVFPLVLTALVVGPVLIGVVLVASTSPAKAAGFGAIALIVLITVFWGEPPSRLETYLHLIGVLLIGGALIWVVVRAVFAPGPGDLSPAGGDAAALSADR